MRRSPRIAVVAGVLAVVIAANQWLLSGRLSDWVGGGGRALAPVARMAAYARAFVGVFATRTDLTRENIALQARIVQLERQRADTDALSRELASARAAVDLRARVSGQLTEAGVTAWPGEGGVRELIIDRGTDDGIAVGDVAATPDGALVGIVRDVRAHRATLTGLGDPAFQVAAVLVGTTVSGLVRVTASDGLILDLVQKDETIQEGHVLATGGSDGLPAGLLIGTVRSVQLPAASLFALVRLTPSVDIESVSRVILVRP